MVFVLTECARFTRSRRESALTCASSLEFVTGAQVEGHYSVRVRDEGVRPQLIADAMDEPLDSAVVPLLAALSPEEATYYACEENAIDASGKCPQVFADTEHHYTFV